jgi:hypothetical protein
MNDALTIGSIVVLVLVAVLILKGMDDTRR